MENNLNNAQGMFLDWNDIIERDGQEYITLKDGDYDFTVTAFERGRFPGGTKTTGSEEHIHHFLDLVHVDNQAPLW